MDASWEAAVIDDALAGVDHGIDALTQLPRHQRGLSPNLTHWHVIGSLVNDLRRWFRGTPVRIDKPRGAGQPGRRLRPDANFNNPRRGNAQTHIEVDTTDRQMRRHIDARNTAIRNVFLRVDPGTGAVVRKVVFAPGAPTHQPMIDASGTQAAPVRLRPSDLFDAFHGS